MNCRFPSDITELRCVNTNSLSALAKGVTLINVMQRLYSSGTSALIMDTASLTNTRRDATMNKMYLEIISNSKLILLSLALFLAGCLPQNYQFAGSNSEQSTLSAPVFNPVAVGAITAGDGFPAENLRVNSVAEASANMVQNCSLPVTMPDGSTLSRYDFELEQALRAAEGDPEQKTIPVEYALSFGQIEDGLAYWAHRRAILSGSNDGSTSYIPVGDKNGTSYRGTNVYYKADHVEAKNDYVYGRKCFFNTVKIQGDAVKKSGYYDFITGPYSSGTYSGGSLTHGIHYMYYGYCASTTNCANATSIYGPGKYGNDKYPNRLFGLWPHLENGRPQIVKLYVADLRDGHFGFSTPGNPIVRVQEGLERGTEQQMNVKEQLDLRTIFRNRDEIVKNLSGTYLAPNGIPFAGHVGIPQLLTNLQSAGATGTLLASQYTPIVLDLGKVGIQFSGLFGGTYFNMAAQAKPGVSGQAAYDFPHKTSWMGGDLVDVLNGAANPDNFTVDVRRQTEDGFLVIPDDDGQVRSSRNLFGDNMVVNGQTYPNGFEALKALANKKCDSSSTVKDRYFGPWDGDLYNSKIKVWVDKNRNGVADAGELLSLKDAGVVAINSCFVLNIQETDSFGNGTAMRSTFLFQGAGEDITGNEIEILSRINTGYKSDGSLAEFRLAIDVLFSTDVTQTLDP